VIRSFTICRILRIFHVKTHHGLGIVPGGSSHRVFKGSEPSEWRPLRTVLSRLNDTEHRNSGDAPPVDYSGSEPMNGGELLTARLHWDSKAREEF